MKRLKLYICSFVILVLAALGGTIVGPGVRRSIASHQHRRDVAAFVACVDKGTDTLVIVDAGLANDGVGVFASVVITEPGPEQYGERVQAGSPAANLIKSRRDARSLEREDERFTVLLGCLLKKVPWAGYFKENLIAVTPHWGWKYNHIDVSGELILQAIIRSRPDMQGIVAAYALSPQAGHDWIVDMIEHERLTILDFTTIKMMGGNTEVPAGVFLFTDLPARTVRIAKILAQQDTEGSPLPTWYVTPTPRAEPTPIPGDMGKPR